ncbi:MAG: hypothetical protein NTX33_06095 [Propionibacteriales bacterium]|nr:hypothetical protein [Propionibacteriales bacterium]
MKNTRTLASVASALVLVTGGASLALIGGGGTAVAAGQPSSAFGLELNLAGNAVIDRTPFVESTDGAPVTDSVIDLPVDPLLDAGLITASAENGAAESSVANLDVVLLDGPLAALDTLGEQLAPLCDVLDQIPVDDLTGVLTGPNGNLLPDLLGPVVEALDPAIDLSLLTALDLSDVTSGQLGDLCDFATTGNLLGADAVTASCTGDTGNTVIEGTNGLVGSLIDTNTPNSSVAIPGVVEVTVNRQTANADGTFTVDAIYVNLLDQLELTVASATCGEVDGDEETDDPSDAPTPTPIETNVPVTG